MFVAPQEPKPDRWIEIASPYINYPTASALNMYVKNFLCLDLSFHIYQHKQKTDDSITSH
jgi:hypothetical protein